MYFAFCISRISATHLQDLFFGFSSASGPRPCRPTTRTSEGMTHPTNHRPHAHTRTHTATTPHRTPAHHPHQRTAPYSTHTRTRAKEKGTPGPTARSGERALTTKTGGPQPGVAGNHAHGPLPGVARDQPPHPAANPSQEWRGPATKPLSQEWQGTNHHQAAADPSEDWRGTAPRSHSQEWRVTNITHQPHPQEHQPQSPTKGGGDNKLDHRHTTHTQPRTPAHAEDTPTPHHTPHHRRGHHKHATHNTARQPRAATHTTYTHNKGHPHPRNTPPQPSGPSQEWRGAAHHHRRRTSARSGGETHPVPSARSGEGHPPPPAAKPRQEWRGNTHRNLRQVWRGTNHSTHQAHPNQHQQQPEAARTGNHTPPTHRARTHTHTQTHTEASSDLWPSWGHLGGVSMCWQAAIG